VEDYVVFRSAVPGVSIKTVAKKGLCDVYVWKKEITQDQENQGLGDLSPESVHSLTL